MIASLIVIGLASLFSGKRPAAAGPLRNICRGNLAYLGYLCSLVFMSASWLVATVMAL